MDDLDFDDCSKPVESKSIPVAELFEFVFSDSNHSPGELLDIIRSPLKWVGFGWCVFVPSIILLMRFRW